MVYIWPKNLNESKEAVKISIEIRKAALTDCGKRKFEINVKPKAPDQSDHDATDRLLASEVAAREAAARLDQEEQVSSSSVT